MPAAAEKRLNTAAIDKLGIIAGAGQLPARLAEACQRQGIAPFLIALKGHADTASIADYDHIDLRLGAVGAMIRALRQRGIRDLVWIGAVRRPSLIEMRPDWRAARFFAQLGWRAMGDDGLLRTARRAVEAEGFRLHGVQDFIGDIIAGAGPLGRLKPHAAVQVDIAHGIKVARVLGQLDIGQAVVMQQGLVLGVEGAEGTAELIRRCGEYRRAGQGPMLIKVSKPQQDRALDMPAIGVATVEQCAAAGFCGIVVQAGHTLLIDAPGVAAAADTHGIFVIGHAGEAGLDAHV